MASASIIVPAYGKNVKKLVDSYRKELEKRKIKNEIIIINEKGKGKGKGWAVKKGFKNAKNQIIGFVDGDCSISSVDLIKVIEKAEKEGIATGKRSRREYSLFRWVLSRIFNLYQKLILSLEFEDTQCGVKFFRKNKIKKILGEMKINGFAFDLEILYLFKKNGENITEVHVKWDNKEKSTLSFFSLIEMAIDVLRIRFLH